MRFFFQAEDGIRDIGVTGVQTCALPILDFAGALIGGAWCAGRVVWSRQRLVDQLAAQAEELQLSRDATARAAAAEERARRSEARRVGKECRSRWSPYH